MKRLHLIIYILLLSVLTVGAKKHKQLVILHTNDTHSTIMPLSPNLDNKDLAGRGGYLRRVNMIKEERTTRLDLGRDNNVLTVLKSLHSFSDTIRIKGRKYRNTLDIVIVCNFHILKLLFLSF